MPSAVILAMAVTAALAQERVDTANLRTGLTEILSLVTLGSVSVSDQLAQINRSGSEFQLRLPLAGFVAPPGAAAEAVAHPDGTGGWDVTSMQFPVAGAVGSSIDQAVSYRIGRQLIHGRLDTKSTDAKSTGASTLAADLGSITLQSSAGGNDTAQTIDRVGIDGRMTATGNGRLDLLANNSVANWHATVRDAAGRETSTTIGRLDGHVAVADLGRAQGVRLMAAARAFMAGRRSSGKPSDLSPAERDSLGKMLDATEGLLTRVGFDETLDTINFDLGGGNTGSLRRLQMTMKGATEAQILNADADFAMDGFAFAAVSAASADLIPHRLTAKGVLAGVPIAPLVGLLRAAIAPNPDQAGLQLQAAALLTRPGAQAGLESVAFDAGPAHVAGSVQFKPRADGEIGADMHISASGIDALLTRLQSRPELQGVLPLMFMAKGMGREAGDRIVWDISLGGGPLTVNGVPFGQPSGQTR